MSDTATLKIKISEDGTITATGNLDRLTDSSDKAEKATSKFGATYAKASKRVVGGALAMTGALAALFKVQGGAIDSTTKHADSLGVTTEALTQFRHAAELTGLGADGLDVSIQRLTRRTNDAAKGNQGLQKAYKDLNLNVHELSKLKPEEQMYEMADAFAAVEDRGERVRLAFQLFGREGIRIINMFEDGSDGLRAMAQDADDLGITLTRIDAAKVEAANDAMYRAKSVGSAFSKELAVQLAPIIGEIADLFTESSVAAGGMNESVGEAVATGVKGASYLITAWRGWQLIIKSSQVGIKAVNLSFMEFTNWVASTMPEIGQQIMTGITFPLRTALQGLSYFSESAEEALRWLESAAQVGPITAFDNRDLIDARIELAALRHELATMASTPMPHETIDEWLDGVRERAQIAAERVASARKEAFTFTGADDAGEASAGADALERLRLELLTEEEAISESYQRRKAIILANTQEGSDLQTDLLARNERERAASFDSWQQNHRDALYRGLLTEEELITQSYERQRLAILESTAITEEERFALQEKLHLAYMQSLQRHEAQRLSLIYQSSSALFGDLADLSKAFAGEQSGIFQALFATSKAFAIADSIIKIQQGIASAAALPFPANIPAMATVAASTAGIVSTIQGTQFTGAYDRGGIIPSGGIGIVGEYGPELVKGPANITGRENTADLLRQLVNQQQGSQQQVNSQTNLRIINSIDPAIMGNYMGSTSGERSVMNIIRNNQSAIKELIA